MSGVSSRGSRGRLTREVSRRNEALQGRLECLKSDTRMDTVGSKINTRAVAKLRRGQ